MIFHELLKHTLAVQRYDFWLLVRLRVTLRQLYWRGQPVWEVLLLTSWGWGLLIRGYARGRWVLLLVALDQAFCEVVVNFHLFYVLKLSLDAAPLFTIFFSLKALRLC